MRTLIPLCLILFLPVQGLARTEAEMLADAQAAFRRGVENKTRLLLARKDFSAATDAYLELHRQGIRNAALYRSLGNTAVLADRWPEAIWAYHVGLKLDPNDRSMREHLAFARGKVLYPPSGVGRPGPDAWPAWMYRPSLFTWACIGFCLYIALCVGAITVAARLTFERYHWPALVTVLMFAIVFLGGWIVIARTGRRYVVAGALVAALVLAGIGFWQEFRQAQVDHAMPIVVMAANVDFHRGNGPSYERHPVIPVLPRGLEARQVHARGSWLQIRLATGEVGWLPRNQVLMVEP